MIPPPYSWASPYVSDILSTNLSTKIGWVSAITILIILFTLIYIVVKGEQDVHSPTCTCIWCQEKQRQQHIVDTIENIKLTPKMLKKHHIQKINGDYVLTRKDKIKVILSNYDIYNLINRL